MTKAEIATEIAKTTGIEKAAAFGTNGEPSFLIVLHRRA